MQILKAHTGFDYVSVSYKGDAPIITALLGGQVDGALNNILVAMPQAQAGKLKPLFVTRRQRSSVAPNLPTLAELGISGVYWEFYNALWAPKGTPQPVIQKLYTEAAAVAHLPEVDEQFKKFGSDPVGSTPEEQLRTYNDQIKFWSEAARVANFKPM
jgi:tripartite-type tricarboxylate transporter receptor subunit TctC